MSVASSPAVFRQTDRSRRDRNVKRSTLSFRLDDEQDGGEQPEQQLQQPEPRQTSSSIAAPHDERKEEEDGDDDGALQQIARMRLQRMRRKDSGRRGRDSDTAATTSSVTAPSVSSIRRAVRDIAVGDDFDAAEASSSPAAAAAARYSKEAMAALRSNAIHIAAPPTAASTPSTTVLTLDDIDGQDDADDADGSSESERKMAAAARLQRARARALAQLGHDVMPIQRGEQRPAAVRDDVPDAEHQEEEDVRVERVVMRDAIVLDGSDGDDDAVAAPRRRRVERQKGEAGGELQPPSTVRFGRVYVEGDDDEQGHGTLLREDDTDDVVDVTNAARELKEADRLMFGDDGREGRKRSTRQDIDASLQAEDEAVQRGDDVDSELEDWEREQLHKGGVKLRGAAGRRQDGRQQSRRHRHHRHSPVPSSSSAPSSSQPPIASLSYESQYATLRSHLNSLRHTHGATVQQLSSLSTRLARKREEEQELRRKGEEAEESLQFFHDMRDWITALLAMLAEKVADVDEAWEEQSRMLRRQGEQRDERYRLYRADEQDEARAELGASSSTGGKAGHDKQAEVQEVDEFGRDLSYVREVGKERRDDVRRTVRQLLRDERERKRQAGVTATQLGKDDELYRLSAWWQDEGWDSEEADCYDDVDGSAATFQAALSSFRSDVSALLQDVDADWRELDAVVGRFRHWKQRYPQHYHHAFIALSMPSIVAPFVRVELMQHVILPPLTSAVLPSAHSTPFSLSSFGWYRALRQYAVTTPGSGGEDEDVHLVGKVVLSVLLPLLLDALRWQWDVRSERHSKRLRDAVLELKRYSAEQTERAEKARHDLDGVVIARLTQAAEDDAAAWPDRPLHPAAAQTELRAVQREAVRAVKLLWTMSLWEGVVDDARLRSLLEAQVDRALRLANLVTSLVSRPAVPGLSPVGSMLQAVTKRSALLRRRSAEGA